MQYMETKYCNISNICKNNQLIGVLAVGCQLFISTENSIFGESFSVKSLARYFSDLFSFSVLKFLLPKIFLGYIKNVLWEVFHAFQ